MCTGAHQETSSRMFIGALLVLAPKRNYPNAHQLLNGYMNRGIFTLAAMQMSHLQLHTEELVYFTNIMLNKGSQHNRHPV